MALKSARNGCNPTSFQSGRVRLFATSSRPKLHGPPNRPAPAPPLAIIPHRASGPPHPQRWPCVGVGSIPLNTPHHLATASTPGSLDAMLYLPHHPRRFATKDLPTRLHCPENVWRGQAGRASQLMTIQPAPDFAYTQPPPTIVAPIRHRAHPSQPTPSWSVSNHPHPNRSPSSTTPFRATHSCSPVYQPRPMPLSPLSAIAATNPSHTPSARVTTSAASINPTTSNARTPPCPAGTYCHPPRGNPPSPPSTSYHAHLRVHFSVPRDNWGPPPCRARRTPKQ
jgi:hypothetical protein